MWTAVHDNICKVLVQTGSPKWERVLVAQLYLTLHIPMDYNPQGSSVHGISQARILEWVAIPLSKGSSWSRDWIRVSCIAGKFFTIWVTRETQVKDKQKIYSSST